MTVTVQEAAPVRMSRAKAARVWVGRFIVDYIETFLALAPAQLLAFIITPQLHFSSLEEAKVTAIAWIVQLAGPAISALVSAGRRSLVTAWPAIKKFFENGFSFGGAG